MKKLRTILVLLFAVMMSLCLFACGDDEQTDDQGGQTAQDVGYTVEVYLDEVASAEHSKHLTGKVGEQVTVTPDTISGYQFDASHEGTVTTKTLSANEAENVFKLYYQAGAGVDPNGAGHDLGDLDEFGLYASEEDAEDGRSMTALALTDSDDEAAYKAKMEDVVFCATDEDGDDHYFGFGDVNAVGTVSYHTVGAYTLRFTLKGNDSESCELTITIDHDWGEEVDGVKTCRYDNSSLQKRDEDVIVHYGPFHSGIDVTLPSGAFTEAEAYTNKNAADSAIKRFGPVNGNGGYLDVPTLTAGQLEPGMKITIRGTSKTTAGETGPWNHKNEYYNSTTIGIADRYNDGSNSQRPGYVGGTSVLVRQEGWVLYNGIGTGPSNRLAGIMGGFYTTSGGWQNYGSYVEAGEGDNTSPHTGTSGYVPGKIPTDWSSVEDWWVYSEGEQHNTGDFYGSDIPIEYSWYYREDGVIEITYVYNYGVKPSTLKAYVKVPDSSVGFYDTVIHGDYNDLTITESEIVSKRTPNNFRYVGLKDGAKTVYAENSVFDASSLNVEVEYKQNPGKYEPLLLANNQIYAYKGDLELAALKADTAVLNSTDADNWISLAETNLSNVYTIYKIHVNKGGQQFVQLLNDETSGKLPFEIIDNRIDSLVGADAEIEGVKFENNNKIGTFTFSIDASKNIALKLETAGYVQKLNENQSNLFSNLNGATRYISLRFNGANIETHAEFGTELTVKAGSAAVPYKAAKVGEDLYLVLALKEAASDVAITGLQTGTVHLDLSTLHGFTVESKVTDNSLSLNGGTVSLEYHVDANTPATDIKFTFGLSDVTADRLEANKNRIEQEGGLAVGGLHITAFEYKAAEGVVTITLKYGAADLENYEPVSVQFTVGAGKTEPDLVDVIDYNAEFSSGADGYAALQNGYVATVSEADELNVLVAREVTDLKDNCVTETFTLNLNNGVLEALTEKGILSVSWTVDEGEVRLTSAPAYVTATLSYLGTWADSRDTDKGLYVIFTIDVVAMGITEGDYYFDSVDTFDAAAHPATVYKVDRSAAAPVLSVLTLDNSYTYELVSTTEGNCYVEGIYAWAVKSGDTVLCYAGVAAAGGEHVDADNDDKCDLCGGSISTNTAINENNKNTDGSWTWFPAGGIRQDITEGDVFTFTGTYSDDIAEAGFGSVLAVLIEEANNAWDSTGVDEGTNGTWHTTQDGFAVWTNFKWETATRSPYAEGVAGFGEDEGYERFTNSVITADHAYNTANGVTNGYGTVIDETNFNAAKQGGTFRFIVTYSDGVITTVAQLWAPNMVAFHSTPYFEYTTTVQVNPDAQRYTVYVMGKQQKNNVVTLVDDKITFTQSKVVNSLISDVTSVEVDTHTAPTGIEYEIGKNATHAVVALSGTAEHENSGYYAAFKVSLSAALDDTMTVKLVDKDGKAITGAVCKLNDDRNELTVYLPIADGMKEAYIDFTNYKAITLQADIKIDLDKLIVSDIESAVDGTDKLTIEGGTFTVTYTGSVQGTDTLYIGDVSKTLAELSSEVDFGNGYHAQVALTAGSKAVVTVKKDAANLNEEVKGIEIRLMKAGSLVARDVIAPALTVSGGTKLGNTVSVKADGTNLLLLANAAFTLNLNVNAGESSAEGTVGVYNVSVNADGHFVEPNLLTNASSIVYSESGASKLYVVKLDLTVLGVSEDTAYGYQDGSDEAHYYTVSTAGVIAQADATGGTQSTITAGSCTEDKVEGYLTADNTFYYNVKLTAGNGHQWTKNESASADDLKGYDEVYTCDNCGAKKYVQTSTTQTWGVTNGDHYKTWVEGTNWETVGILYQGGVYELTGTNLSNEDNVWEFPEPGITDQKDTNAQGFRLDNYVENGNTALGVTASYEFKDAKNESFTYSFENITAAVKTYLDGATITYTFDYTKADKLVITMHLVNGTDLDFTVTVTVTGSNMHESYYIALHPDANIYTATKAESVVPQGKEPADALTKHVHDFNNENDRCETDGVLNPDHGNTDKGGKAHSYDTTHHCTICGQLNPAHSSHTYNQNGNATCECGAIDPSHTHNYSNGYCTVCGHTKAGEITYELSGKTYTGTLADQNIVNNDKSADEGGNGLTWWNETNIEGYNPASSTVAIAEGDFLMVWNWTQFTIDPQWPHDAVIEFFDSNGQYIDQGFMQSSGAWGDLMNTIKGSLQETITHDGKAAAVPAGTDATGYYTVKIARIGTTLVIEQTIVNSLDGSVWTVVDTYTGMATGTLTACITGNPYGCENLKGYYTALTAQA